MPGLIKRRLPFTSRPPAAVVTPSGIVHPAPVVSLSPRLFRQPPPRVIVYRPLRAAFVPLAVAIRRALVVSRWEHRPRGLVRASVMHVYFGHGGPGQALVLGTDTAYLERTANAGLLEGPGTGSLDANATGGIG